MERCDWGSDQLLIDYHDTEWGTPVHDEQKHFEFLVLEFFQAGLNWRTMLAKRENFRKAFDGFDYTKVARYSEMKIEQLMNDAGIIRNRRKINAAINNAAHFLTIQKEWGSFDSYIWSFTNGKTIHNHWKNFSEVPVTTELSDTISKDMKKRGFAFVGSTTIYAHIQAIGIVNDHLVHCFRHKELKEGLLNF